MGKAKEYLQRLKKLNTIIDQKVGELSDLRAISKKISNTDYSKDRVQTYTCRDAPFTDTILQIIELEHEINREIDAFVDEKHRIINQIQSLQNSKYIEVLYRRYVEFKQFEEIAVAMNYTYDYVRELHGYALRDFEKTHTIPQSSVLQ